MPGQAIVLDDDEDMRELLADLLEDSFGFAALRLSGVASLIALDGGALGATLAILDVNLGPGKPSGLDAYAWLRAQRYAGRVVFMTGHAMNHPLVSRACQLGDARMLAKPFTLEQLAALIGEGPP